MALGGVVATAGLVGGGLVVALIVTTLRGASTAAPVVKAVAVASTVAARVRDGLSNIPRARVLPFNLDQPKVVFVPVAPTRAEIEVVPQPPRGTDPTRQQRARVGPSEPRGPIGARLLPVQRVDERTRI